MREDDVPHVRRDDGCSPHVHTCREDDIPSIRHLRRCQVDGCQGVTMTRRAAHAVTRREADRGRRGVVHDTHAGRDDDVYMTQQFGGSGCNM